MPSPEYNLIRQYILDGEAFKARYTGGTGSPMYQLIPYLIGTSPDTTGDTERALCWKYVGSDKGWRCFRVSELDDPQDATAPLATPLPEVDEDRQNCIVDIDPARRPKLTMKKKTKKKPVTKKKAKVTNKKKTKKKKKSMQKRFR